MQGEAEFDELVMTLVEAVMALPPEERDSYLQPTRTVNPELYAEVRRRVEWEERMGGFLKEPVMAKRAAPERVFEAGELVNGRFRIIRSLGHGGMGLVYEAHDQKLDRRVALKCAKSGFQSQLSPEARAALEVSHPNVCKLHELHTAETAGGPVDFLTMEFIDGQTLADRLRDGPLKPAEVRAIALEACAGLAQAHRQGVVHGDIKPGNVMISRSPAGQRRTVLTDFGLAKLDRAGTGVHVTSLRGGTLDYMAPELFQGARASVASDIYALGVMFQAMLTGASTRPKGGPSERMAAIQELPAPWNRVVKRCVAADPEQRFKSAEEIAAVLSRRRPVVRWALAAALVIIAALLTQLVLSQRAKLGPPIRLAVLPAVVEGAAIPAAPGILADVANRLSGLRSGFTVMPPGQSSRNQVDTPAKARSGLGATHALSTRLHNNGTELAAVVSVVDAASGNTIRELRATYGLADSAVLAQAITATVTRALGLPAATKETLAEAAYPYYVRGLALLRPDNDDAKPDEAIPLFEKAIQIDSGSVLPLAGLADAQLIKFDHDEGRQWLDLAGSNVAKAKSLNPDSVPVLIVSGGHLRRHGWYEQAIAEFSRAVQLDPGNSNAWSELAQAYADTNRPVEAVATFRKAIDAQPGGFRFYQELGNFYVYRNEYPQAEAQYRRVTEIAPGCVDGHMDLGLALMQQGHFEDAEGELLIALKLKRDPLLLMNLGALYYARGSFQEAVRYFEASLNEGPKTAFGYRELADGYRRLGRKRDAEDAYRAARGLAEEDVTRNPRKADSHVLLGLISAGLGDAARAGFELSQALSLEPENAMVMREAALAYEALGQRDKALEALSRAPVYTIDELARHPDAVRLSADPRFQALIRNKR